jgi:hypothetical protein
VTGITTGPPRPNVAPLQRMHSEWQAFPYTYSSVRQHPQQSAYISTRISSAESSYIVVHNNANARARVSPIHIDCLDKNVDTCIHMYICICSHVCNIQLHRCIHTWASTHEVTKTSICAQPKQTNFCSYALHIYIPIHLYTYIYPWTDVRHTYTTYIPYYH